MQDRCCVFDQGTGSQIAACGGRGVVHRHQGNGYIDGIVGASPVVITDRDLQAGVRASVGCEQQPIQGGVDIGGRPLDGQGGVLLGCRYHGTAATSRLERTALGVQGDGQPGRIAVGHMQSRYGRGHADLDRHGGLRQGQGGGGGGDGYIESPCRRIGGEAVAVTGGQGDGPAAPAGSPHESQGLQGGVDVGGGAGQLEAARHRQHRHVGRFAQIKGAVAGPKDNGQGVAVHVMHSQPGHRHGLAGDGGEGARQFLGGCVVKGEQATGRAGAAISRDADLQVALGVAGGAVEGQRGEGCVYRRQITADGGDGRGGVAGGNGDGELGRGVVVIHHRSYGGGTVCCHVGCAIQIDDRRVRVIVADDRKGLGRGDLGGPLGRQADQKRPVALAAVVARQADLDGFLRLAGLEGQLAGGNSPVQEIGTADTVTGHLIVHCGGHAGVAGASDCEAQAVALAGLAFPHQVVARFGGNIEPHRDDGADVGVFDGLFEGVAGQ